MRNPGWNCSRKTRKRKKNKTRDTRDYQNETGNNTETETQNYKQSNFSLSFFLLQALGSKIYQLITTLKGSSTIYIHLLIFTYVFKKYCTTVRSSWVWLSHGLDQSYPVWQTNSLINACWTELMLCLWLWLFCIIIPYKAWQWIEICVLSA